VTIIDIVNGQHNITEKVFGSSELYTMKNLGFYGLSTGETKPELVSCSSSGLFDYPWITFAGISVDLFNIKIVHNFEDDNWVEMLSSYPLFICDDGAVLSVHTCDFVMGKDVNSLNGIVVCRSAHVECIFSWCTFRNMNIARTTLFYDGGNSTVYLIDCLLENITSSCMRGSIYYTLNLTLDHNAEFINTTIRNINVSNAAYGGLVYYVSSIQAGNQIINNCSISDIAMALLNPNAVGGGAVCYANTPNSISIINSVFQFIRRPQKGGAVFLNFAGKLLNQTVFVNNVFKSLEAVNGGAIYTNTNVSFFLFFFFFGNYFYNDILGFN
jgi:hypothetical protein